MPRWQASGADHRCRVSRKTGRFRSPVRRIRAISAYFGRSAQMTRRPFVNVNGIELMPQRPQKPETGFEARMAPIAGPLGATKLGCRLTVVPPGKKAFPHHVHHVNDELFVILSGEGTLRFGAEQYPVASGDVIVCPAGGADRAHQLIHTSARGLPYSSI